MKAYLYNVENGLYAGESFEEPDMLVYEDGVTTVPPPDYGHGQVPVFDKTLQTWTVISITVARQLLKIDRNPERENAS